MARIQINGKMVGPENLEAEIRAALEQPPMLSMRDPDALALAGLRQEMEAMQGQDALEVWVRLAFILLEICERLGMTDGQIETVLGAEAYAVVMAETETLEVVTENIDD